MSTKTCPGCLGSGRGVGSRQRGPDGVLTTIPTDCPTCSGRGYVNDFSISSGSNNQKRGEPKKDNSCFPASTQIMTPTGAKSIEALLPGDDLITYDALSGRASIGTVLRLVTYDKSAIWTLNLEGGRSIRTTASHSFFSNKQWRPTHTLRPSDSLLLVGTDGKATEVTIVSIESTSHREPVFNIVVDGDFTFIANGALAHCFTYFRGARTLFWSSIGLCRRGFRAARRAASQLTRNISFT